MAFTYPRGMKRPLRRLNSLLLLYLCIPGMTTPAPAQVAAGPPADARPRPEVALEARVLGIPSSEFRQLGIIFPEASDVLDGPLGFAVVLPEGDVQALLGHSRTTTVHSLKLQGTPGSALRFRVDSRVPADANSFEIFPPYFEVSMAFEVTPGIFPGRRVGLSSSSVVQVRRGAATTGGLAPMVFETLPIRHDIQIPEGKTILLGGFLTASNSMGLPPIPVVQGNAFLGYVGSKSPRTGDQPEIVVLLTPRVIGPVDDIVVPAQPAFTAIQPPPEPVVRSEVPPAVVPAISIPSAAPKPDIVPPLPTASLPVNLKPTGAGPMVPPAAPRPKSEARFYTVQAGAFGSNENAEKLASELKKKFEGVFIDSAGGSPTPYRVRVGRVSTLGAARRLQSQLEAQGFDSYVVIPELP
jgi:cell division septation protein DedD